MSDRSIQIIEARGHARKVRNLAEFERLSKEFRKSRKTDRQERVLEGLTKELDLTDRWLGIRELKSKYNPSLAWNRNGQKTVCSNGTSNCTSGQTLSSFWSV